MVFNADLMEMQRVEALKRYRILDTPPEAAFDHVTALAAMLLGTSIALIAFPDADRVWFKSRHGIDRLEIQRNAGLFPPHIPPAGAYVVEDMLADPLTRSHPLVTGKPGLRFHVAVPLVTPDGHQLGTLCLMDERPRQITVAETGILKNLAVLVMDLMELRLAGNELAEANALLLQLNTGTDQFVMTAVHDLRTPLSAVTLLANLMAEQQFGPLNPSQNKMVASICGACKEMVNQLDDYAELASCSPDRIRLEKFPTDVKGLVHDCVKEHQLKFSNQGIRIVMNSTSSIPEVSIDSQRFRRALGALFSNSVQRSGTGGTIQVRMLMEGRDLVIEVNDKGPGVSQEEGDLLFNSPSEKRSPNQTGSKDGGLAMPIARRLIQAHGGQIGVVGGSVPTFFIKLPPDSRAS